MTCMENFLSFYNSLEFGTTTRSIMGHCLTHMSDLSSMTINQLAEACYTSPATISRLVKVLGYRSYSAFQHTIKDYMDHYHFHNRLVMPHSLSSGLTSDILHSDMEKYLSSIEGIVQDCRRFIQDNTLESLASMLHKASHVAIFPYGFYLNEMFLQSDLFFTGIPCDVIIGDSKQIEVAAELPANSFAMFLTPDTIDSYTTTETAACSIKQSGGSICLVTTSTHSPFQQLADITVTCEGSRHAVDSLFMEVFMGLLALQYRHDYFDK